MSSSLGYPALYCRSNASFLQGASHPEELIEEAERLAIPTLALVDRDGVYGAVRAWQAAKTAHVRFCAGSEITLADDSRIVLLAQNRVGWANLCHLITLGRRRCPKGSSLVHWDEVCDHHQGLLALWGGRHSLLTRTAFDVRLGDQLYETFGDRLYAMLPRHRVADETLTEPRQRQRTARWNLPELATPEVVLHSPQRKPLHDVLTAIHHGVPLHRAGRLLLPNATYSLQPARVLRELYADVPQALGHLTDAAARLTFRMEDLRYRYPAEVGDGIESPHQRLTRLTWEGAHQRYGDTLPEAVRTQLHKELALIQELDYGGYFLTMYDIVIWCRQQDILCQGRGSAANSAVCFCLGITAVDPVRMDLLFERFLSRERAEPPDIDLDIAHQRREEVIQWVYQRHGRSHAAMVANLIRYRPRSAVRDVGRALGLPETSLDRLAKQLSHYRHVEVDALQRAGLDPTTPAHIQLVELANELIDMPRHLSIHPGGFLLGHEPIATLVPVENATMPDRTVIQWDKDDVEALGLFKVDLLGLGALTHIDRCFRQIQEHHGETWTLATLPVDDDPTWEMLARAQTIGVFQIESRAQMSMLPRLRPRCFYDLVIEVSIVRPGPISGDMVHPYLRRRHGKEPITYPHAILEPVLRRTLGVPLFQEQVMKLAIVAADYTPGEADQLRRDMAAWRRTGRMEHHRERLLARMTAKGIAVEFAERVFAQIRGFGEYGFPESHAASFALLSWATAWLRCHYRATFTCSLLNAWPMGFYSPATILDEARRDGLHIRPICVLHSQWECTLEPDADSLDGYALRIGLRFVHGLPQAAAQALLDARAQGRLTSTDDLFSVPELATDERQQLAAAGALEALQPGRRQALWQTAATPRAPLPLLPALDDTPPPNFDPLDQLQRIQWDYAQTGSSAEGHLLLPMRPALKKLRLPDASTVSRMRDGARTRYAGLVICRQRPGTAGGVVFMTLEDETGFVNLVLWQRVFEDHAAIARSEMLLGVTGLVQNREGVTHLIAESLWVPQLAARQELVRSRDFH